MSKQTITEQFESIIAKDLPNQVGKELQKVLAQAELDAQSVIEYKQTTNHLTEKVDKLQTILDSYSDLDDIRTELDQRKLNLNNKEKEAEVDKLNYQLEAEKSKTNHATAIGMGLVRNTVFRESAIGSAVAHDGNGYPTSVPTNSHKTTETE